MDVGSRHSEGMTSIYLPFPGARRSQSAREWRVYTPGRAAWPLVRLLPRQGWCTFHHSPSGWGLAEDTPAPSFRAHFTSPGTSRDQGSVCPWSGLCRPLLVGPKAEPRHRPAWPLRPSVHLCAGAEFQRGPVCRAAPSSRSTRVLILICTSA